MYTSPSGTYISRVMGVRTVWYFTAAVQIMQDGGIQPPPARNNQSRVEIQTMSFCFTAITIALKTIWI